MSVRQEHGKPSLDEGQVCFRFATNQRPGDVIIGSCPLGLKNAAGLETGKDYKAEWVFSSVVSLAEMARVLVVILVVFVWGAVAISDAGVNYGLVNTLLQSPLRKEIQPESPASGKVFDACVVKMRVLKRGKSLKAGEIRFWCLISARC